MPRIFTQEQLGKDRINGFYETPLKTVEYICNKILPYYKKGKKILDPAVGDGIFLYALNQSGVDRNDLYGFDINDHIDEYGQIDYCDLCEDAIGKIAQSIDLCARALNKPILEGPDKIKHKMYKVRTYKVIYKYMDLINIIKAISTKNNLKIFVDVEHEDTIIKYTR